MRRIIFYISVAVITFLIGFGCDWAIGKYRRVNSLTLEAYNSNQHLVSTIVSAVPARKYGEMLPPGSLPAELKRIDEHYQKSCVLPTDWTGEWATIKQISEFNRCNEEWAKERQHAIKAELANYLVRY